MAEAAAAVEEAATEEVAEVQDEEEAQLAEEAPEEEEAAVARLAAVGRPVTAMAEARLAPLLARQRGQASPWPAGHARPPQPVVAFARRVQFCFGSSPTPASPWRRLDFVRSSRRTGSRQDRGFMVIPFHYQY